MNEDQEDPNESASRSTENPQSRGSKFVVPLDQIVIWNPPAREPEVDPEMDTSEDNQ